MHQKISVLERLRWPRTAQAECDTGLHWWNRAISPTSIRLALLLVRIGAAAQHYALTMIGGVKKLPLRTGARGWIGVDLDGTLAEYHGWKGIRHIGPPVPAMLERVNGWLREGVEVRIFTARVSRRSQRQIAVQAIGNWCERHGLPRLQVTNIKDFQMIELWDDRAVRVEINVGRRTDEQVQKRRRRRQGKRASLRGATPVARSLASDGPTASPPLA
jgi:hypothetical protein